MNELSILSQQLGLHSQSVKIAHCHLLIKNAHHDALTVYQRNEIDAQIELTASLVCDRKTAVLRFASLRDIQLSHDLDTRYDGGQVGLGKGHLLVKDAVLSESHP